MGFGDDIMATALAKAVGEQFDGAKAVFGDPETYHDPKENKLSVHWSEVFKNNPHIVQPGEPVTKMVCIPEYPGHRMSIDYDGCQYEEVDQDATQKKILAFAWTEGFHAPRGELFFSENEKSEASEIALRLPFPFIVIEPAVANKAWINHKAWPWKNWQEVVDRLPEVAFVQLGQDPEAVLKGAHHVLTPSFRQACAILSTAGGFLGTDGGLHHAAAALNLPAVVLWGHYSSPEIFGYDDHLNIRYADGRGCGSVWQECPECHESMKRITVDEVVEAVLNLVEKANERRDQASCDGGEGPVFRMVGTPAEGGEG